MTTENEAWEMGFAEYVDSRGGVYLPFPAVVEFVYSLEWSNAIFLALLRGVRPPSDRVAEALRKQSHVQARLPPEIAVDYPELRISS